jgi:hypothetical protein
MIDAHAARVIQIKASGADKRSLAKFTNPGTNFATNLGRHPMRMLFIRLVLATLAIGFIGATVAAPFASAAPICSDTKAKEPK